MIAFEILINGVKICTAGVDTDYGVLTSILSWAKRDLSQFSDKVRKKVPEEELKLTVSGHKTYGKNDHENLQWIGRYLNIGDEITINIIDTLEVDEPKTKKRQEPEFAEKQKFKYYRKLKEEYE